MMKQQILMFSLIFILSSCNYRTPSKIRFEKITNINLPDSIEVLEDRFESSGPNYGLFYEFKLNEEGCSNFFNQIKKSSEWTKTKKGWEFHKTSEGIIYNIIFINDECEIRYNEDLI